MADNVDLFADVAAALFAKLYVAFPVPVDIETDLIAELALADHVPFGATPEAFVEASLLWLASANFIAFTPGQLGARMIEQVGLTAIGFRALQAPCSSGDDETIGRALSDLPSVSLRRSLIGSTLAGTRG